MDKKEPEHFDIRYTILSDRAYLKEWLSTPSILEWFAMSTEREIEELLGVWMGLCRYKASLTATIREKPCGIATLFLMPYQKVAHHALFQLVVDPHLHNHGIGSSLLRNLKHLAKNYFFLEKIHIEVWEGNPFISLLQKEGFSLYGKQERYVKLPGGKYQARYLYEFNLQGA